MQYDYTIVIGRFQPVHIGHISLIQKALDCSRLGTFVLVGSSTQPRDIKNPFNFGERLGMIAESFKDVIFDSEGNKTHRLLIQPLHDHKYNDLEWIKGVQERIQYLISTRPWSDKPPTIAIVGYDKDHSTDYLKWFPQWDYINMEEAEDLRGLNATQIRDMLFNKSYHRFVQSVLPPASYEFIIKSTSEPWWKDLEEEYAFIQDYKKQWANSPYPPTFVTVDAVVVQAGHVLLVERKANPGKGLWALPGGFLNQNERIQDAVIRELREETKIKVPEPVLRGSIVCKDVFDHPDRSMRGRTITHVTLFKLASTGKLPAVKGSDDAKSAKWVPLANIYRNEMFEDHYDIINFMCDKL